MKKSLVSIAMLSLLLAGAASFARPEQPQDSTKKQRKHRTTMSSDTASDTRLDRNTMPRGNRTDSIPMPVPTGPDTIRVPMRR